MGSNTTGLKKISVGQYLARRLEPFAGRNNYSDVDRPSSPSRGIDQDKAEGNEYVSHQGSSSQFLKHITISQDQTAGSNFHKEQLAVLQPSQEAEVQLYESKSYPGAVGSVRRADHHVLERMPIENGKHALQDYQMPLMLLERQNKKRQMISQHMQQSDTFGAGGKDRTSFEMSNSSKYQPPSLPIQSAPARPQKKQQHMAMDHRAAPVLQQRNQQLQTPQSNSKVGADNGQAAPPQMPSTPAPQQDSHMPFLATQEQQSQWPKQRQEQLALGPAPWAEQPAQQDRGRIAQIPVQVQGQRLVEKPISLSGSKPDYRHQGTSVPGKDSGLPWEIQSAGPRVGPYHHNDTIVPGGSRGRQSTSSMDSLNLPDLGEDSTEVLLKRIKQLEVENESLKQRNSDSFESQLPQYQVFHRILDVGTFLGEPSWILADGNISLKGDVPLSNPDMYLKRHSEIAFIIYKNYFLHAGSASKIKAKLEEDDIMLPPEPISESIKLVSRSMIEALLAFCSQILPDFNKSFSKDVWTGEIPAPYLFWYRFRSSYPNAAVELHPYHRVLVDLLAQWIEHNYGQGYRDADTRLKEGHVSRDLMKYYIIPGDVYVVKKTGFLQAFMAQTWVIDHNLDRSPEDDEEQDQKAFDSSSYENRTTRTWYYGVDGWSYEFDGSFSKKSLSHEIELKLAQPDDEVEVQDMEIFPLKLGTADLRRQLKRRGRTFWSCRYKKYISYRVDSADGLMPDSERFMIDILTYKELHSEKMFRKAKYDDQGAMSMKLMKQRDPPVGNDLLLFPNTIIGYNFRRKKWVDLEVDRISDVVWNKMAFETLVVDDDVKELIHALVTNQLASEKSTDLISGKGNGLIVLLHGGPGTGKTFTAESVAELAEKPLFRVTCGDIGTQPEAVEKYLESVLHLGKIWGCVVLLDEADVFLEERGLADLQRNALVSVFLRVLEYYEGILILTSNRVGTFDEAFKSRIQLALHYENLGASQRTKIWKNFLHRLKAIGEKNIDFDDIDCYISELAAHEMNGRQIRNAITTARELAQFKKKDMSYKHLQHVIGVANKFDTYLKAVKEGFSDDQIARTEGIR